MGNQKWTIQRNWQHRQQQDEEKQNTTQYKSDTTMRNQTYIT